jgi:hypothetical protein
MLGSLNAYSDVGAVGSSGKPTVLSTLGQRQMTLGLRRLVESRVALNLKQKDDAIALTKKVRAIVALVISNLPSSEVDNLVSVGVEKFAIDSREKTERYFQFLAGRIKTYKLDNVAELEKKIAKVIESLGAEQTENDLEKLIRELGEATLSGQVEKNLTSILTELDQVIGLMAQNETKSAATALAKIEERLILLLGGDA